MDESSYGLIVEGPYDEAVFPELVRKIASQQAEVVVRVCGGAPQLMKHFPSFLRDLEHVRQGKPVDKAVVIRDWRGPDAATIEREMARRVQGRRFGFPRAVQFCAVRQEMEAWLLADVNAINDVARERRGRTVPPIQQDIEQIGNPKEMLMRLLLQAKLPYDPEVCREIAHRADVETLKSRCPSFRSFETKVTDC